MSGTDQTLSSFLDDLSARTSTPGGGSLAPVVGAMASALGQMVVRFSSGSPKLETHAALHARALQELSRARSMLLIFASEDAAAYDALSKALRLSRGSSERAERVATLSIAAMQAPLGVMAASANLLRLFHELAPATSRSMQSDLLVASILAEAGARASREMVRANLPLAPTNVRPEFSGQADALAASCAGALEGVKSACAASVT